MLDEKIYTKLGRGTCYSCGKQIEGHVYMNTLDHRIYCCSKHAIEGKKAFIKEKEEEEKQGLEQKKAFEKTIKNEIKSALKDGFKKAKEITLFKATSEPWDTNPHNLSKKKFINLLNTFGSYKTVVILKILLGQRVFKGKKKNIICKYNIEGVKTTLKLVIELIYPKKINFKNFDKYKVDFGFKTPLIIIKTKPKGKVVITKSTKIKIIHDNNPP